MENRGQWMLIGVTALAFSVLIGVGLSRVPPASGVGMPAPDFRAEHLGTGDSVSLASYRGEVILLNLWATWCTPCEAEMPSIQRLYQSLGPDGLRVLAVSVDEADRSVVKKWADERALTFDILHDRTGRIQQTYRTIGLPESFVIDREGRVVKRVTGFILEWDAPDQLRLFRRLLARAGPERN